MAVQEDSYKSLTKWNFTLSAGVELTSLLDMDPT